MPIVLEITGNGFYIPMDRPWDCPEDNEAYKLACETFDRIRPLHPYVVLIISHHWTTPGYWVEIKEKEILFPDRILKGGGTIEANNKVIRTRKINNKNDSKSRTL